MFSVVIPLYNKQNFIARTIGSVLAQSYSDFEIVVVDDGSTDASLDVVKEIMDARLRIVEQSNAGEGAARNTGMRHSRGEWIALLDADDYWFPDHLAELARMVAAHPEAGMLATSYLEGENENAEPPTGPAHFTKINYFRAASRHIGIVWSSAVALRRSIVEIVGGFGPFRNGADLEYWARMALVAPVIKSKRVTAYYFRNDSSVMRQLSRTSAASPAHPPPLLTDLWPPVAYFEREKIGRGDPVLGKAIHAYTRNAGYLAMAGLISSSNFAHARAIGRSLPTGLNDKASLLRAMLQLPDPVIEAALRTRRFLRGLSSYSKSNH